MAVFEFDPVHLPQSAGQPPRGEIKGTLDPGFAGPGTWTVTVKARGAVLAEDDGVESPDGDPVSVTMSHADPGPSAHVTVEIDGTPQGVLPVPIRLRS